MEIFKINDEVIEYNLEKKRIKNYYISVKDGTVTIKVPTKTSKKEIEELIEKRATWILENVDKQKKKIKKPYEYSDGEIFKVLGKDVILKITYDKVKKSKLKFKRNQFFVILPLEKQENSKAEVKKLVDEFYTQLAEKEVEKAMRKMSMKVGFAPNSYKIKNLKSTWGNCATTGNISINKNVVMYSRHAIEYVCLHEICHLQNMNHSKMFWDSVEKYMPNYKKAEDELKNG